LCVSDTQLAAVKKESAATPEVEVQPAAESDMPANAGLGYYLYRFLNGPNGKAASDKIAEILGAFRTSQVNTHRLELLNALARYALLGGILWAAVSLQMDGKLDSAIIGLLSLVTGYIFGRQKAE
jgi:hypothetical protein